MVLINAIIIIFVQVESNYEYWGFINKYSRTYTGRKSTQEMRALLLDLLGITDETFDKLFILSGSQLLHLENKVLN